MALPTLLDIAKLNGNDAVVGLIEENIKSQPELSLFPARQIRGTSFKTVTRTGYPTTQFRSANGGVDASKSTFTDKIVECFIASALIKADRAVADAYEFGAEQWKALEASGVMESIMRLIGTQMYYGISADAKGFAGFKAFTPTDGTGGPILNANGTTASTASSAYFLRFGDQDVSLILGQNTTFDLSDWRIETAKDANNKEFPAYVSDLTAWVGLHIGNVNSVGRIYNLTADSGKGLTNALISKMLAKFPVGKKPTHMMVSRRSMEQLQASLTVTSTIAGNPLYGRYPSEAEVMEQIRAGTGLTTVVTDSILDTDAINS